MGPVLIVILVVVALVVLGVIVSYNRFVRQRNLIRDAWANIDTELRRRYDLIPNLVETVKGYASHEREVFENVTKARAAATAGDRVAGRAGRRRRTAGLRPAAAVRGRGELPGPEGEPELPAAADRAGEHRGPAPDGAPLLQLERP